MHTFYVTSPKDSGPNTLRDAIDSANSQPLTTTPIIYTIIIKPSTGHQITLLSKLEIKTDINLINQTGEDFEITTTTTQNRIFHLFPLVHQFTISSASHSEAYFQSSACKQYPRVILSQGMSDVGGAIYSGSQGQITLKDVILKNNTATNAGGAIFTLGSVKLIRSKISRNQAGSQGGGIWSAGSITLKKSIISRNSITIIDSTSAGAGVYIDAGDCKLCESQITKNQVAYISTDGGSAGGLA